MLIFVVILASGVIWFASLFSAEKKLNELISDMKSKGKPTSIQDLKSKSKPDARNAAVIYDAIFKQMGSETGSSDKILARFLSERREDPSSRAKAQETVDRYRKIIPMIESAVSKPDCSFAYTWPNDPFQTIYYTTHLRFLNRILCSMAILDSKKGKLDNSLHNIELGFELSESLNQDPWIMGQQTRWSMIAQNSARLREVISHRGVNETDLRHFYDALSKIDLQSGLETALDGEVAVGISSYDTFHHAVMPHPSPSNAIWKLPVRGGLYQDESYYLEHMNISVDAINSPYYELKGKQVKMPKPPKSLIVLSDTMISLVDGIWWRRDMGTAEVSGSRILVALMAYRSRYGNYPSSLDQLRSKLKWVIPEDPFTGKDFIYKTKGKGFLLYSIGPNLKDDSGIPHNRLQKSQRMIKATASPCDIVWEMAN
ncbi:MAG: hypothetical protein ACYC0V_05030 [Armatimonadota bacterium]